MMHPYQKIRRIFRSSVPGMPLLPPDRIPVPVLRYEAASGRRNHPSPSCPFASVHPVLPALRTSPVYAVYSELLTVPVCSPVSSVPAGYCSLPAAVPAGYCSLPAAVPAACCPLQATVPAARCSRDSVLQGRCGFRRFPGLLYSVGSVHRNSSGSPVWNNPFSHSSAPDRPFPYRAPASSVSASVLPFVPLFRLHKRSFQIHHSYHLPPLA